MENKYQHKTSTAHLTVLIAVEILKLEEMYLKHPGLCSPDSKKETGCYLPIHQNQAAEYQEIKTVPYGRAEATTHPNHSA